MPIFAAISMACRTIPCEPEQGIKSSEQGTDCAGSGISLVPTGNYQETPQSVPRDIR